MKKMLEIDLSVSDDIAFISFCKINAGDSVKQIEVNIPNGIVIFDLNLDGKIISMEFINALALLPEDVRIAELEDWDSSL
ncbi:MAG: hypothetical protein WC028_18550 [Candidatus Obscuribacterales bacterium]